MSDDSDFYIRSAIAMLEASNEIGRLEAENRTLRKAIAAWKPYWHDAGCSRYKHDPEDVACSCGAAEKNETRAVARKAAGLED